MADTPRMTDLLIERLRDIRDARSWNPAVLRKAELCLLDSLTCFSTGRSLAHFAPHATVAASLLGGRPPNAEASPLVQAYIYGQAANALDHDDTLVGHPGASIIGALLPIAIRGRLPLDRILRGIAAGYEAHWMLNMAAEPTSERASVVRSVNVWDTVSAGIGAAVALGLDDGLLGRVIGLAATHSLIPYTAKWYDRPVPGVKNNLGWVATGAVLSLDLALAGQTGLTDVLEGDKGMWRMAGSDRWTLDPALCDRPAILRTGFKRYPACWDMQAYVSAVALLVADVDPADEIVEIVAAGPSDLAKFCNPDIHASADIAFSLPAIASLLICGVEPGPAWDDLTANRDKLRFRTLVRYRSSDRPEITLSTRGGRIGHAPVTIADPLDPSHGGLDEAGVIAKHARFADPALRAETASALAHPADAPEGFYRLIGRMMAPDPAAIYSSTR